MHHKFITWPLLKVGQGQSRDTSRGENKRGGNIGGSARPNPTPRQGGGEGEGRERAEAEFQGPLRQRLHPEEDIGHGLQLDRRRPLLQRAGLQQRQHRGQRLRQHGLGSRH